MTANRRMFSLQIVDTDAFLEMPTSSQLLYFHLVMRADDEGFVGSPKRILKIIGVQDDDLKILIAKRFVLVFDSGIVVIKHWLIHNTIRMDRLRKTTYQKEKNELILTENKAYTEALQPSGNQLATKCQRKISKDKISKDKLNSEQGSQINILLKEFEVVNPTINYGNKTQRKALEDLIEKFGYDKLLGTIKFAVSVQGESYAPTITTPIQLKNKLGDLMVFYKKEHGSPKIVKI